jgi:hypothetical protein
MKKIILWIILILFTVNNNAQFDDVFSAAQQDAEKFVHKFTQPLFKGLMYAANSGWANSAKPLQPYKFEFKINASGALIPGEYETFQFDQNDYNYLRIDSGSNILPTIMGGESQSHLEVVLPDGNNEIKVYDFYAPDGLKNNLPLNLVPMPSFQLSMGFLLGSEVQVRYVPKVKKDGAYTGLLGLGVKHSISQYFSKDDKNKKKKDDKKFNLAVQVIYQYITAGYESTGDKAVSIKMNNLSYQAIASLDYKLISIYSSVGHTGAHTNFDVLGTYEYTYIKKDNNGNIIGQEIIPIKDPLQTEYDAGGMKATIGLKLKLMFLSIFADYTFQEFPVANAGIGINF